MFAKTFTALTATAALGALIAVAAPTTSAEAASRHYSDRHVVRFHRAKRVHARGKAHINHSVYIASWKARKRAIRNWRGKVANRYGWRFNKWFMARGKNVNCNTRRFRVVCHVSARPKPISFYGYYRGHDVKPRFVAHSRDRVRSRNRHRRHAY